MILLTRLTPVFICLYIISCAFSEDLERNAPESLRSEVLKMLTPIEEVLKLENPFKKEGVDGTVLLSESITWVEKNGKRWRLLQHVYRAHTAAGADSIETSSLEYSSELTNPYLLTARTLTDEGKWVEVGKKEAFLQRGRGDENAKLYDDDVEVVIIFPEIKEGSLTQTIILYEDKEPRVGNEYVNSITWSAGWPYLVRRRVVDLPSEMAERLNEVKLGNGVPERQVLDSQEGRWRAEWKKTNSPRGYWEISEAPTYQVGPVTLLSTWKNWNQFADWYSKKLEMSSELGDDLKKTAEGWVGDIQDDAKILNILLERTSKEIRYTGLEFGTSGIEPYSCETVWKRKFGDCKDKSNLLVQLLKHFGIKAKFGLVNTEHAGIVNKKSVSYHAFDHAILAVKLNGEWVFCDPTITGAQPGMLSPSSSSRSVFLIDGAKGAWVDSPKGELPEAFYEFKAQLNEEGRLSGWMNIHSKGIYKIFDKEKYIDMTEDAVKRSLTKEVQLFFKGSEVIDFKLEDLEGKFVIKAFFTSQPTAPDSKGRYIIPFPTSSKLFNNFGDINQSRKTNYFMWRDHTAVTVEVNFSDGFVVEALPKPIILSCKGYEIEAKWSKLTDGVSSELKVSCSQPLLSPEDVISAAQANLAFNKWAATPLFIVKSEKVKNNNESEVRVNMPLLNSASAQLDLVDEWFPLGSNDEKRKVALEEVIRYFPQDQKAHFSAHLEIAYIIFNNENYKESAKKYRKLASSETVDLNQVMYAQYMWALSIEELGETDEAIRLMKNIVGRKRLSTFRRGWAAATLGGWTKNDSIQNAQQWYEQALSFGDEEYRSVAVRGLFTILAKNSNAEVFVKKIEEHLSKDIETLKTELDYLLTDFQKLENSTIVENSISNLIEIYEKKPDRQTVFKGFLKELQKKGAERKLWESIRTELNELFDEESPEFFHRVGLNDNLDTREKYETYMDETFNIKNDQWLAHGASYIKKFESNDRFTKHLWDLARYLIWLEKQGALKEGFFLKFMNSVEKISHLDDNYWECQFVKAEWLENAEDYEQANTVYKKMLADSEFNEDYEISAVIRRGKCLERLGRWDEAIESYNQCRDSRFQVKSVVEHMLRSGILLVLSGRDNEALKVFKELEDVPLTTYDDSELLSSIEQAIVFSKSPNEAKKYWNEMRKSWAESYGKIATIDVSQPFGLIYLTTDDVANFDEKFNDSLKDKDKLNLKIAGVWGPSAVLPTEILLLHSLSYTNLKKVDYKEGLKAYSVYLSIVGKTVIQRSTRELVDRLSPAVLLDLSRNDEAYALVKKNAKRMDKDTNREHFETLVNIYLIAATRVGDINEELRKLSNLMCSSEMSHIDRVTFSKMYTDLLFKESEEGEAVAFLKKQLMLKLGDLTEDKVDKIKSILDSYQEDTKVLKDLRLAMKDWISRIDLPWYNYIEAVVTTQKEIDEVTDYLNNKKTNRHDLELFKLLIEVSLSDMSTKQLVVDSFSEAIDMQSVWAKEDRSYLHNLNSLVKDSRLTKEMRESIYTNLIFNACYTNQRELMLEFLKEPNWNTNFSDDYIKLLKELLDLVSLAIEKDEVSEYIKVIDVLANEYEPHVLNVVIINDIVLKLLINGELDSVKKIIKESKSWSVLAESREDLRRYRLSWDKTIRVLSPVIKNNENIKRLLNIQINDNTIKELNVSGKRKDNLNLSDLSEEEVNEFKKYRLFKEWNKARCEPWYWYSDNDFWLYNKDGEFQQEAYMKVLKQTLSQPLTFDRLVSAESLLTIPIDKKYSAEILELLSPYEDVKNEPDLYTVIQTRKALWNEPLKNSVLTKMKESLEELEFNLPSAYFIYLFALMDQGKINRIHRALDDIDSDVLLDPYILSSVLYLLKKFDRNVEFETAQEEAEVVINKFVLDTWRNVSSYKVNVICKLIIQLDNPNLLPQEWSEHVVKQLVDENKKDYYSALFAYIRSDWKVLEELAPKIMDENRDFEALVLYGVSLLRLKKNKQALEVLTEASKIKYIERKIKFDIDALLKEATL